jgi:chorismate mutase
MRLNDKQTLSIAAAVGNVLEGKTKKEEAKYPHDMFHPETGEKEVAKDEADHKALAKKGYTHEKPEVEEAGEPKAKGEKEFKGKHTVKKSGEKEDGSVVKEEVTISITEAKLKAGKGKAKIDIDHEGDDIKATEKKFKVKFKKTKDGFDLSGQKKDILAYLQSNEYDMDAEDIEDLFPELMEDVKAEEKIEEGFSKAQIKKAVEMALKSDGKMTPVAKKIEKIKKGLSSHKEVAAAFQLANEEVSEEVVAEAYAMNEAKSKMEEDKERYQKFFKSALKKFGVDSPAQLKGDKKKEFFDYVDKNYEADNEED